MRSFMPAAVVAFLFFAACSSTQVLYSVYDHPIAGPSSGTVALEDVTTAILEAGAYHGWKMTVEKPGHIVATLEHKNLMAQLDIRYTTGKFSIIRKDSRNFHFEPGKKTIHKRFNRWIRILEKEIPRFISGWRPEG